jgi:hypothetical protein
MQLAQQYMTFEQYLLSLTNHNTVILNEVKNLAFWSPQPVLPAH